LSILTTKNNEKIAFFDSGIGGLTVFSEFKKLLPNENCIYFGDIKHLPYGNKSKEQLLKYSRSIFNFFQSKNVKAVVVACNTSSAATYSILKDSYNFKIYPILQESAKVIAKMDINTIGVFATQATINSNAYETELLKTNPNLKVYSHSCPEWVNIVESASQNKQHSIDIIKNDLDSLLKYKPDKIILGCTHYPYLINILSKFADRNIFIDPAKYFVHEIKSDLEKLNLICDNKDTGIDEFYVNASVDSFKTNSKMFYNTKNVELINI